MTTSDPAAIRDALETGAIRRVLAVRASRLGDLLMTTPTLHAFRERWPEPELLFLTNPYSRPLLEGNTDVDELVPFEGRERALATRSGLALGRSLRARELDLCLALRPRREVDAFAEAAEIPRLWPPAHEAPKSGHVVERCFDALRALGVEAAPGPLRLCLRDDEVTRAAELWPEGSGPPIVCHPGCDETIRVKLRSGVRRRVWPPAHWSRLVDLLAGELGARVVLTSGSRVEASWVERVARACKAAPRHLRGLPLRRLAALLAAAALVVTVDTGPLHIATAVGTPLLGLYGPSPAAYTGPWAPRGRARVLQRALPCSPCQGRDVRCLANVCMEEIRPPEVFAAATALL